MLDSSSNSLKAEEGNVWVYLWAGTFELTIKNCNIYTQGYITES